jgi:hypothetical protein
MPSLTASHWRSALQDKGFRNKLIITTILLVIYAAITPSLFEYIQGRKGHLLNDYLLDKLPSYDLSVWIFTLLYILIASGIILIAHYPWHFLTVLQAYVLLSVFRTVTMLLFPLEPPANIIELNDPLVNYLFYQQSVTKDLFFSGHTSVLALLTIAMLSTKLRFVFFMGTISVACMLLFQHAHYTIDVLFAPVFSWLAFMAAKKIP